MYEDRLILHQWILESEKVVWIDKAFYHYVKRSSSICHVISPLQRYHFFLAQFCRLEFINNNLLFDTEEQYNMKTSLVKSCLRTFKEMRSFPVSESRAYVVDMKNNLKKLIPLSKKELDIKCYKRLRKIVYFWPIYYWIHFKLKKINSGE
jgi:glycosyltransferase yibD